MGIFAGSVTSLVRGKEGKGEKGKEPASALQLFTCVFAYGDMTDVCVCVFVSSDNSGL